MRICFVTNEFLTEEACFDGGLANYLYRVAISLQQLGHEPVIVVTSSTSGKLDYDGIEVHRVAGNCHLLNAVNTISLHRIETLLAWPYQSWRLNQKVRQLHRDRPLDIIQYTNCAATALFRVEAIPAVLRISSFLRLWEEAYGNSIHSFSTRQVDFLECRSFHKVDQLFGPSRLIGEAVEKVVGKSVRIIETPFLLKEKSRDSSVLQKRLSHKKYLLFFGTIGLLKGLVTIADALDSILSTYPDLHFVFVGKDTPYQQGLMMDYVREKAGNFRDRIIHIDKLRHEQLYPIIEGAHAVVLPSRIDNFPNTCLEAMAHSKVVIGTLGTSFEQLIVDGESGFLCRKDDPQSLSAAVDRLMKCSPDQLLKMGEKARQRIDELKPEKVVQQLLDFYSEVIRQQKG